MKKPFYLVIIVLSFIALVSSGCLKSTPVEADIPIYSISEDIINPPDTFQIVFPLRTSINYTAIVEFNENAVWKLEHLSARESNIVWVERADSTNATRHEIITGETRIINIGFEGGVRYNIIANRTSSDDNINLFLEFTKLPDEDYDTHSFNI